MHIRICEYNLYVYRIPPVCAKCTKFSYIIMDIFNVFLSLQGVDVQVIQYKMWFLLLIHLVVLDLLGFNFKFTIISHLSTTL